MHIRSILAGLLLAAAPLSTVSAQVEWRIANFANTATGFTGALQFRNTQTFTAAPIVGISAVFLTASTRAQAACAPSPVTCGGWGTAGRSSTLGNVDKSSFVASDGVPWRQVGSFLPLNCQIFSCFQQLWAVDLSQSIMLFGCATPQLPGAAAFEYAGRTCQEQGFDGWINIPFVFSGLLSGVTYTTEDVIPAFTTRSFNTPNSYVPEPSTYALMVTGMMGLSLVARVRSRRTA